MDDYGPSAIVRFLQDVQNHPSLEDIFLYIVMSNNHSILPALRI